MRVRTAGDKSLSVGLWKRPWHDYLSDPSTGVLPVTEFLKRSVKLLGPGEPVILGYTDWGPRAASGTLVCVHGLTRQGRDFDAISRRMERYRRVVCPDMVGRGTSSWLGDKSAYRLDVYVEHMKGFLASLRLSSVDWLGTSMGGLIGMALAAEPDTPIKRLILNDIGPFIPATALADIGSYVGRDPVFGSILEAAAYLSAVHAEFGDLTEAQWADMAQHSVTREPDRTYRLHYDPAIAAPFREKAPEDADLWGIYGAIRCPILILRGANSKLLTAETAEDMTRRSPPTKLITFDDCGHAPALVDDLQIDAIVDWLEETEDYAAEGEHFFPWEGRA